MKPSVEASFEARYITHLQHLKMKGLQPKTIDAYARAIRRIGEYFDRRIDDLSESQLAEYFTEILKTHSWTTAKLDWCGLKFYYQHVLKRPWVAPNIIRPPKVQRLPDIVTVAEVVCKRLCNRSNGPATLINTLMDGFQGRVPLSASGAG